MNIATIIDGHPAERTALIDDGAVTTYGDLRARVDRVRAGLSARGVSAGQRIMLVGENETEFVIGALAILGLGAAVAPIRARNPLPEAQRKIASVSPDHALLCTTAAWLSDHEDDLLCPSLIPFASVEADGASPVPVVDTDADDLAFLMLTSGVSSNSKVAMLSHNNLAWIQEQLSADPDKGIGTDDVALGVLPLTHIFGLNVVLFTAFRVGAAVVLQAHFDPDESLRLVRDHQITAISGAPAMWQRFLATDAPDHAFALVTNAASGAAPLSIETFNRMRDRFGVELSEGYGLTETAPVVTWSRGIPTKPGSVGKALDGVEVLLVEPDGTPVEDGDTGEIVVRSPGVFKGYLDAPELSEEVLTDDGWFWTGDMGVFDADGYLYIVDRIKDLVIVNGFNVYPAEVETVLMEHPGVTGAIVVGARHDVQGEMVVAHISGSASADDLDAHCRARLSRYKCPSEFHFLEELPLAPNGKKMRRALR